jgi:hypothetical protein
MHVQTKSPNTLRFIVSPQHNLNKSYTITQWNHKFKQHNKQMCNACYRTIKKKNLDSRRRITKLEEPWQQQKNLETIFFSKELHKQKNHKSRRTTTTKKLLEA